VYGAKSEFGRCLVDSCITLSVVTGLSVSDVSAKAIANLGWNNVKLPAPVFAGDTIYAESEVIEKRESKTRPNQGIVSVRSMGKKADGTVCIVFERTLLIPMRGHALDDKIDY
jgi:acyl dehydratase